MTGSRLGRQGYDAPTPTTVVTADDLARRGFTNIGQIANSLPAFQAVNTPTSTTLTSVRAGGSYLNLRGLGDNRTLVLVNSRRFVATNTEASIDTNVIPTALIDRIDIVTGGASAAYGSDAVAGVVNIVLKRNLKGFVGDIQNGISERGDNADHKGSLGWGTNFADDRGHFMIAGEAERNEGVGSQTTRKWGRNGYAVLGNPSGGTPSSLVVPDVQYSLQTLGGLILSGVNRGTDFGPGGAPRPFVTGPSDGFNQIGGSGFRGADYLNLAVPFDRYSFYGKGDYDFGGASAFVEASHSYSRGLLPIIPASNFGSIVIQRDNAYLDAGLRARMVAAGETSFQFGRFFSDFGPLIVDLSNRTDRVIGGFEGKFGQSWKWTVYGEYGHTLSLNDRGNNQNLALFAKSVDAVIGAGGQPVCRVNAVTVTDAACLPVNIFGSGSPSAAAQKYFLGVSRLRTTLDERVGSANLTGDLFQFNDKPVSVAVGAEYRTESTTGVADPISQVNGFAFGNPKSLAGDQTVKEAYGELLVPLLHDLPFAKKVDIDGAARVTNYSGSGTVVTWKAGATWDVSSDFRVRVTRSRDIRAPNLSELFGTSNVNFVTVSDPVKGTTVNVPETTQGNPALRPETANTFTAGIVLTPSFLPGLRASVDYYDIKINGAVTILTSQETLNRCFAGNTNLCQYATRDTNGVLTALVRTQVNVNQVATRGVDFEGSYTFGVGQGRVNVRGLATYIDKLATTNGAITIDRAGEAGGNNNGLPHWRFNLSATYANGPLTLFVENRYVGGGNYDNTLGPNDINFTKVKSADYTNLSVAVAVLNSERRHVEMFFNVNNLLDKDPSLAPSNSFAAFQTNPVLYDVIGRTFSAGVRFRY